MTFLSFNCKKILLLTFFLISIFAITLFGQESPNISPKPLDQASQSQGNISGIVVDSLNGEPIPFASITLKDVSSGNQINGTISDENGKFSIKTTQTERLQLEISFVGYETRTIKNITLNTSSKEINLGKIQLSESKQQLKEVVIIGQKSFFEEKVDRTVYNAESDATNKGGDATDVLRKVPMLSVDMDGNVSMRGSQNITVLINNKPSTISASSVADALKQIPAEEIKTVEVITSPSSKYDAEGSTGVINIITKRNLLKGFTLNAHGSGGIRGSNLGVNGNFKKGKNSFSIGTYQRQRYNIKGSFINNQTTSNEDGSQITNIQNADTRNRFGFGNYKFAWEHDINKNNFLSASAKYSFRNGNNYQDNLLTQTFQNNILLNRTLRDVNVADLSGTWDGSLTYTRISEKVSQREFNFLAIYSRNNRTNDFYNNILGDNADIILNRIKNQNQSFNQESAAQVDFQTPIKDNQMLEVGVKNIFRQVSSNFKYFISNGPEDAFVQIQNTNLSNIFDYNQNVSGAYASYAISLPKSYSLKAGGRYEYTIIDAQFKSTGKVPIPSYGIFVPSVNVSKKLPNGHSVKASFNRRIQRPSLQFLNPNIQASNPLNITIGNPTLDPEFTNNYELSYSAFVQKTSFTVSSFARSTNNSIQSIRDVIGNDTIRTTYRNIGQESSYGVSIFANINISNVFSINGGTDVYYAVLQNNVPNPVFNASNEGWVASYRVFGNYNLPKGWGFQLFGFYRARQVQLQGYQGGFGIYSLSIKKDFNNKKGSIGFGAENFFTPAFRIPTELNSPFITQKSVNTMHNMNFKINFSYRIGKLSVEENKPPRKRKSISNDDVKEEGDNKKE